MRLIWPIQLGLTARVATLPSLPVNEEEEEEEVEEVRSYSTVQSRYSCTKKRKKNKFCNVSRDTSILGTPFHAQLNAYNDLYVYII